MQPRQRSKCVTSRARSSSPPRARSSSARCDRAASPSPRPTARSVGQVGRQKPQCTQSPIRSSWGGRVLVPGVVAAHHAAPGRRLRGSKRSFTRCISARVRRVELGPTASTSRSAGRSCTATIQRLPQRARPPRPTAPRASASERPRAARPTSDAPSSSPRSRSRSGRRVRGARDLQHERSALRGALRVPERRRRRRRSRWRAPPGGAGPRPPRPAGAARRPAKRDSSRAAPRLPAHVEPVCSSARLRRVPQRRARAVGVGGAARRGGGRGRQRVQPHGQLDDQPERPERAGEQLGEVVARDVLDHLAAALRERAVGQRHAHADDQVAQAAVAGAQRAGVGRGHHAADGGAARSGGSSASIWPALANVAWASASGTPASSTAVRSPALCSTISSRPGWRARSPPGRGPHPGELGGAAARRGPACRPRQRRSARRRAPPVVRGGLRHVHQNRSATPACSSGWRR